MKDYTCTIAEHKLTLHTKPAIGWKKIDRLIMSADARIGNEKKGTEFRER
jgi:hypothetical protein